MSQSSSKKKTSTTLNAVTMRYILSAMLVLMLTGMAGSFYFAYTMLHGVATEAAGKQAELRSIDARVSELNRLKETLAKNKQSAERAAKIAANAKSYQYQNQVVNDLNFYAATAGVSIESFTFKDDSGSSGSAKKSAPTTKPATGNTPPSASPAPNSTASAGGAPKSTQVSIQLSKDVGYTNLLHFLHLLEKNLTRMQIADLSLARGENNASVSVQALTLEVYIR